MLSDKEKRKQYDMFGADGLNSGGDGPGFDYNSFFGGSGGPGHFHFTFDSMFNGDNTFGNFFEEDDDFVYFPANGQFSKNFFLYTHIQPCPVTGMCIDVPAEPACCAGWLVRNLWYYNCVYQ